MSARPILVLGAAGFVGRHLASALARAGVPVVAGVRSPAKFENLLITEHVASFDTAAQFADLLKQCDTVIHAASISTPGSSMATPQLDGNLRTTLALLEALQDSPHCNLVYISSAGALYGERSTPASEADLVRPRSYHGAGKVASESFIHAWAAQYDGSATILRPTNIYGPGQRASRGFAIVPTAMDCALSGKRFTIWGDGRQTRDFLFIDDFIELCLLATKAKLRGTSIIFNAASGHTISVLELISHIEQISGLTILTDLAPQRASDTAHVLVDASSTEAALGWRARHTIHDGLSRTWRWFTNLQ